MKTKRIIIDYLVLIAGAAIIIFLDQWTKDWIRANLAYGEIFRPEAPLSQYARILHWRNTGIVFGLFQDITKLFNFIPAIISVIIFFYYSRVPREDWLIRLSMVLYLGGGIGNLIDRVNQGYVTDFISVGNFAVFNIADACITLGVFILALGIYLKELEEKKLLTAQDEVKKPGLISELGTNQPTSEDNELE